MYWLGFFAFFLLENLIQLKIYRWIQLLIHGLIVQLIQLKGSSGFTMFFFSLYASTKTKIRSCNIYSGQKDIFQLLRLPNNQQK